jgi:hypothetical protein
VQSRLSDLDSRLVSDISDLKSALAAGVPLDASTMSDIRSAITAGGAAAITVSDISDIASAVWANVVGARVDSRLLVAQSMASDAHSAATVAGSRALVVQSRLSDLDSRLVSDISDVRSQLDVIQSMASDAHSAAILGASHASDAHSAATQAASRALLNQSRISDVYSLLSDVASDLTVMSGVLSDVYSAIGAGVEIGASSLSDLRSAITANGVLAAGAEPAAVPAHTASMSAKVDWLTALARNKITQTATKQVLRNGSDTATLASATVSDDGTTFTRSEWL